MVLLVSSLVLGWNLAAEPWFSDESAYFSQSYFCTLFFSGRLNDPAWLDYPGCDLPPLTKYLIGAALHVAGYPTGNPGEALAWYNDTSLRFDPPGALNLARSPIVLVGSIGCLAIYGIGRLVGGRATGLVAAGFLMVNPLYRLHAHRAMSDVPCESFLLLGLCFGLWAWTRQIQGKTGRSRGLCLVSGVCTGLSILAKLSGLLGLMVEGAWVLLGWTLRAKGSRKVGLGVNGLCLATIAVIVFIALNPYLTAQPKRPKTRTAETLSRLGFLERVRVLFRLRFDVSAGQQTQFAHNALRTPGDRLAVSIVQGFGRFGPFGPGHSNSVQRFELRQDWGALVWLPWVMLGIVWASQRGLGQVRAGEPPTAWAVLVYFVVAFGVVTLYLPMAWDRYLLPIEAPAALLASGATVAGLRGLLGMP